MDGPGEPSYEQSVKLSNFTRELVRDGNAKSKEQRARAKVAVLSSMPRQSFRSAITKGDDRTGRVEQIANTDVGKRFLSRSVRAI